MVYLIKPASIDIMPDGSTRYYSNGGDITDSYGAQQKRIREMLGTSYRTLMDTLQKQIKGFDQDCSNWGEEQNIQLEIRDDEVIALFDLWEYAADEYPNCRVGDTIGEWTCREIIVKKGCNDNEHSYLVLFTRPLTQAIQK
ncbi:MAG: hypothetical protein J6W00_06110 [Lentisphaeria bacterium]|nr:hypothetical protein [Lentisphaeria bacterium]